MADSQSILQLGIEAARAGDKAEARELFRLVTREDPNNAQGWLWLAGVAEDREEKRVALEHVIQIDPSNDLARKGLAALGSPSGAGAGRGAAVGAAAAGAAAGAAASGSTTAKLPAQPGDTSSLPPTTGPASDQDIADAFDSIDDYAAAPESNRARVYEQPEQVGGYVPPDFGDDDYDLSEYQNKPRVTADDIAAQERANEPVVLIEDEEPRRSGIGAWLPALIILAVALIGLFFWISSQRGNDSTANNGGVTDPNGAVITDTTTAASAAPGDLAGASPLASDLAGASPAPGDVTGASPAPGDLGASPAPGDVAGASPAPGDLGASPAPGDVAGASPAPGDVAGASPAPGDVAGASPAPSAAPAAPPAAVPPADVASANPAIVPNGQALQAGSYQYSFASGLSNIATGSYGGATPSRGRYLIVLAAVANTGSEPLQIPDGFFVIKDAQGRVYDFNRAASVDYINRFGGTGPGGAGDYAADATLPPGAPLGSMPLLFDVAPDATNLVMFSRDNLSQGFLVRQAAQ
jgi:hypothetical protein